MAKAPIEEEDGITHPRETLDFVGHDEAEHALLDAIAGGRLPHAWLISGPEGIGKATLAFRFARHLLANPPGDSAVDGGLFASDDIPTDGLGTLHMDADDPIFRRVAAAGHGDVLTVERQVNDSGKLSQQIRIDDVRQAIDFAHMTSSEGGYKVIIVDGAELMNRASENAFL
jgi:DNA polymerase-3 subunit delta'